MTRRTDHRADHIILLVTIGGLFIGTLNTIGMSIPLQNPSSSEKISPQLALNTNRTAETQEKPIPRETPLQYTLHFSTEDLSFTTLLGYDQVTLKDGSYLTEPGKPMLPIKTILIAVPDDMKTTTLSILSVSEQLLPGTYTIFPAQHPRPIGETSNPFLLRPPNPTTYASPLPYPAQLAVLGDQTDLVGQSMVPITIYPVHYLPLQHKLTLVTSIMIRIQGTNGYTCGDYLSDQISENARLMYQQQIQNMVINPEDVHLLTSPHPHPLGVGPGDYEYVIITQDSWVSAFQPLADWKTQKGVPTAIVTTDWIYNSGGYSGTNIQKIRAFAQDVHTTWGTIYLLLGGDTDIIPCQYQTFPGVDPDPVPNDAYYADFDADWICELNIGRASVTGPGTGNGQIGNFINKILTYEKNPPLTNYAQNAGFFGFDLDAITHAYQCKININNAYIPTNWTVTTVYDNQGGNHKANVIAALNAGQNLANHADHSNETCIGVGYYHHNWLLTSSDVDALTNGDKQTILYSMGCDPAAFDVSNCFAEHFVRNSNGGGIAFIGNSRYGWYNYAQYNTLSMAYDVRFFESLFQENWYHLGVAFSDHKNDVMQSHSGDDTYQYCYTELTLLGDPELPVWTTNPATLVINHPLSLPVGSSSFTVHVQTPGGAAVENAYVCLQKGIEVYQRGYTNSTGNATFPVAPSTTGALDVTVTKQNYLPMESTAQVIGSNLPPNQPSSPSPANDTLDVPISIDVSWVGGDPNPGDTVTYDVYFGTSSTPSEVTSNQSAPTYDPGVLNETTTYYWMIIAWDNHGASTTGPIWHFTTQRETMVIKNLSQDWNFLALPFNQSIEKQNLTLIYDGVIYSWQDAVAQSLILDFIFGWDRTNHTYEIVDALSPGQGYWMFAYHDCVLCAEDVNESEPDAYITDLLQTWNLIGSSCDQSIEKQQLVIRYNETLYSWQDAVTNSIVLGFVYEWDDVNQTYHLTDVLHPGKSYWMYAYDNCTLLRSMY
jgi:hypothetical protein